MFSRRGCQQVVFICAVFLVLCKTSLGGLGESFCFYFVSVLWPGVYKVQDMVSQRPPNEILNQKFLH